MKCGKINPSPFLSFDPPGVIKAWGTDFSENLTCAQTKNVTLEGGYNKGYTANNGFTTLKGNLSVEKGSLTVENIIITASNTVKQTYTIFGRINYNGTGLSGVAVALSGASAKNTTTDVRGDYKFPGLSNGSYTVTPTRTGYTITPKQVTINNANALLNFTAVKDAYTISGRITYNGTGMSGALVTLAGAGTANTTTDSNGNYTFTGLSNGTYTIIPSLTGYLFTPANLSATVSNANVTGKNFTSALNSITHPSSLVGTWNSVDTYTEDSDGEAPYTETGSGKLNTDGTINDGDGAWAVYKNMLVVGNLYDEEDGKGIGCDYFPSVNSPITGYFEEKDLDGYYWWGRGTSTVTKVNSDGGSDQKHLHPANLVGTWSVAATYTSSSDGNPGSHNSTETVTLNADGTVSARGAAIGFWFSDGDIFAVGFFWDKAAESGFKCNFMNLSGTTNASGKIEDKKLTGSAWWGRGNVTMTKH
jgi:hypothetical protein